MSEEEMYEELVFFGGGEGDRKKDALTRAHDIRKFEIELYWKRALYFWGFEAVLVAAFALVVSKEERDGILWLLAVALSLMGFFISIAWHFMSKGGKAWQENWERHIDFLEDDYEGKLHKTVIGKKEEFYSVSRINQDVIVAWCVFWCVALLGSSVVLESLFCLRHYFFRGFLPVSAIVVAVLIFLWGCYRWKTKTGSWKSDDTYHIHTREKKLKERFEMSNTDDIRWKQRLESFGKAYALLHEAMEEKVIGDYSRLEQEGIVKRFEYTYELAWKTLKDWLFIEGYDEKTPRSVIKRSFEVGFFSEEDTESFLAGLGSRNMMSHMYDDEEAEKILSLIQDKYEPMLGRLYRELEKRRD